MKARIFRCCLLVALCALLLCTGVVCGLLYRDYENRVYTELAHTAKFAARGVETAGMDYLRGLAADDRVTWVAADGAVLFDSAADPASMENHADREEIIQALKTGAGRGQHFSDTLLAKTQYYALRLSDGTVLRVSSTGDTAAAAFVSLLEPLVGMVLASLLLSALLASRLARVITEPLNRLDLDRPETSAVYAELKPLTARIAQQNRTIRSQMDALSARQREFEAITENMSEGFLLADNRAGVLTGNQSALSLLAGEDGAPLKSLRQPDCPPQVRQAAEMALAGRRAELVLRRSGRDYQVIANPVSASGQVTGAVLLAVDVTEREQREALRQEFTANVSHELKTPLTSISGFAELMKEGLVEADKIREFSAVIYGDSQRLIRLVEDILELSKLDENAVEYRREPVELSALADGVLEGLQPAADKKHLSLRLEGSGTVLGVWQILDEMVYNLCDNAIKYNIDGGSVTVTVRSTDEEVLLTVADTGIGIPAASQSRVFERFYRVDKSHSRQIGGTGLGLSIVKHGAQFHGARVALESEPGRGTAVTLTFQRFHKEDS